MQIHDCAFIRPISARYPVWLSSRASERILVWRLERRSRQRLGGRQTGIARTSRRRVEQTVEHRECHPGRHAAESLAPSSVAPNAEVESV